jgi:lipopolysaccharide biosynthesis glycosyltransferase
MTAARVSVFLASDEAYAPGATATLASAVRSTATEVTAYVVDVGLSAESRSRLDATGASVVWIRLDDEQSALLRSFPRDERHRNWTTQWVTFARVLIPELLPPDLDRVVYLDTDTVVLGEIADLAAHDLKGKSVGAVEDHVVAGLHVRKLLGRDPARPLRIPRYFNAGVMLIDLVRWRRENVTDRLIALLRQGVAYYDQDNLNLLLRDDWTELPEPWNRQILPPDTTPAASSLTARHGPTRAKLLEDAKIVHFMGSRKPWMRSTSLEPELLELHRRYAL